MKICTSRGGLIWLFETDEGSARWPGLVMSRKELDALGLTKARKQRLQIFYGVSFREVPHKEVALLLRILESKLFSLENTLSFNGSLCRCHV